MQEDNEARLCCILSCPEKGPHYEESQFLQWQVRGYFCREHSRELSKGMPLGGAGLDPTRLEVVPEDSAVPKPGGVQAVSPQ